MRNGTFLIDPYTNIEIVIDLHCHMLPGLDDGAASLEQSLAMARMAVADGITVTACTPHVFPGVYNNTAAGIRAAVEGLSYALLEAQINLVLVPGADVHIAPNLLTDLQADRIPCLGQSRYFLFEPPHDLVPPRMEEFVLSLAAAGYMPIVTHPERLQWIESRFDIIERLADAGIWMQLTAGSLLGQFGKRARIWSERMLERRMISILCSDAHDLSRRPPILSEARDQIARMLGEQEAEQMVWTRPLGILMDKDPRELLIAVEDRVA